MLASTIGAVVLLAQQGDLRQHRRELGAVNRTVEESRRQLNALDEASKQSQERIAAVDVRAARLDSAIGNLLSSEQTIADEMISLRAGRDSLNRELDDLLRDYACASRALFRHRLLTPRNTMLLMPEEHRLLALKQRLFDRYAALQKRRATQITAARSDIERRDSLLSDRRRQQLHVIGAKRAEILDLVEQRDAEAARLADAQAQRESLAELIERKNAEASRIERMIDRMVAHARSTSASSRADATTSARSRDAATPSGSRGSDAGSTSAAPPAESSNRDVRDSRASSGSEATMADDVTADDPDAPRALFRWPVAGHRIVEAYGRRVNPRTNTVTINPGINIAAPTGSVVTCVDDGTVSLVSWLPSYGTLVIVEHDDGYRTVYANLASADVSRGTRVRAGQSIGVVGESHDGEFLHFEVWHGRDRLDPTSVLR